MKMQDKSPLPVQRYIRSKKKQARKALRCDNYESLTKEVEKFVPIIPLAKTIPFRCKKEGSADNNPLLVQRYIRSKEKHARKARRRKKVALITTPCRFPNEQFARWAPDQHWIDMFSSVKIGLVKNMPENQDGYMLGKIWRIQGGQKKWT